MLGLGAKLLGRDKDMLVLVSLYHREILKGLIHRSYGERLTRTCYWAVSLYPFNPLPDRVADSDSTGSRH